MNLKFIWPIFLLNIASLSADPALFSWHPIDQPSNFGDALSLIIVEKIIGRPIQPHKRARQLLAVGSILHFAHNNDTIWGAGINGKVPLDYHMFHLLDVRSVRGPLTRNFLLTKRIPCPEIYGDPALLLPLLFPELSPNPIREFIVIPSLREMEVYSGLPNVVLPTEDCMSIIHAILESKLVISGSLHGIIVAESFGIPAILLRLSEVEHLLKYDDYYQGTKRTTFPIAYSLEEALHTSPPPPPQCDLQKLLESFPYNQFY